MKINHFTHSSEKILENNKAAFNITENRGFVNVYRSVIMYLCLNLLKIYLTLKNPKKLTLLLNANVKSVEDINPMEKQPQMQINQDTKTPGQIKVETESAVSILLLQLKDYYSLEEKLKDLEAEKDRILKTTKTSISGGTLSLGQLFGAGQKEEGAATEESTDHLSKINTQIETLGTELNNLSDSMKFQTPMIWMLYKSVAYKGTTKHMETVAEFIEHLKNDTICKVRMMFLENYLSKKYGQTFEEYFGPDTKLEDAARSEKAVALVMDKDFISKWQKYENNTDSDGKVDKWLTREYEDFRQDAGVMSELKNRLGIDN